MENIIKVRGLTKIFKVHFREQESFLASVQDVFNRKYRTIVAVDNLNLNVRKGEIHALLGPNGAGKSTTIKILSGVLYPTQGELSVMGYIPWKERQQYVKQIGVLFGQKTQLIWELPANDTYLIYKEIYKIPPLQFRRNLDYLVNLFDIGDIIKKPARTLSLGERMKCEFVCTLLHEPRLVFLDEPTIGMDIISKDIVRDYIKRINKELGVTFILTSHDLGEITNLCRMITIINYGTVVFDDSIDNLKTYYSNKKVIELKFNRELFPEELNKFHIKLVTPLTGTIEIVQRHQELQTEIAAVIKHLPVKDINIYENSIETIIKNIYQQAQNKKPILNSIK